MSDRGMIPASVQGLAIVVLLYTVLNAVAAGLVILMHMRHGDPFGYVPLCACFMIVNIVAAFIQQIHFYTSFESIQIASYNYQIGGDYTGKTAFTGTSTLLDTALYEIQLYCYNVESLLFLSWIAGLWRHVWRLRIGLFDKSGHIVSTTVKIASAIVPAVLIGIANASSIDRTPGISLVLCNILLAGSVAIGLVFLVLVFYKYLSVQRYLSTSSSNDKGYLARFKWRIQFSQPGSARSKNRRSRTIGSQMQSAIHSQMQSGTFNQSVNDQTVEYGSRLHNPHKQSTAPRKNDSIYDKWLLIRFCICFVLLCIMQIFLIYYSIARYLSSTANSKTAKLDFSSGAATIALVMFIPGVTLGLLIFIVFGTTGPFRRDYATWIRFLISGCSLRNSNSNNSFRSAFASSSLHQSESVTHLANLSRKPSRDGSQTTIALDGKSQAHDGDYSVSVTPVGSAESDLDQRHSGAGIMMTRSIKQTDN